MAEYIESLTKLSEQFAKLGGVGRKSAMRMAFSVLELSEDEVAEFAAAIVDAKQRIHMCPICQNLTDREICPVSSETTMTIASLISVRPMAARWRVPRSLLMSSLVESGKKHPAA